MRSKLDFLRLRPDDADFAFPLDFAFALGSAALAALAAVAALV